MEPITFSGSEFEALEAAVGRTDAPAHQYIDHLERLARAYQALLAEGRGTVEIPGPVRADLEAFMRAADAAAEPLHRLPEDPDAAPGAEFERAGADS